MHIATALERDVAIKIRPRAKAAKEGEDFHCWGGLGFLPSLHWLFVT